MSSEPTEKKARKPATLGYWDIRGLAQPTRLLLKYTGTEFEDVRYKQGDAPNFSREEWLSVKETLGLGFPNLPYFIDCDVKLTQSNAILYYIGRKNGLAGKTTEEEATIHMLADQVMDMRNKFVRLCYSSNAESMKEDYLKELPSTLKRFSTYIGENSWSAGNELSYADFHLYEMLDQHKLFCAQVLDDFPNLKAYVERFEALPAIKEYMESPEFHSWPVNNKIARWGGVGEKPNEA